MAERFRKTPRPGPSLAGLLLFLLPLPLVPAAIHALARGRLGDLVIGAGAYAAFLAAALLTRRSLKREQVFSREQFSRPPDVTPKRAAALIVAGTTACLAWFGARQGLAISIVYGALALLGFVLAYGWSLHHTRRGDRTGAMADPEAARVLEEAEQKIRDIEQAARTLGPSDLAQRLVRIAASARQVLDNLAADPGDIRRARKFLHVYLDGARRVAEGYARTHGKTDAAELETRFRHVLDTIERVFAEQQRKLLEDDVLDLDVQIEVLRTQLEKEGVV